jgi:creatinine amidohydrolase
MGTCPGPSPGLNQPWHAWSLTPMVVLMGEDLRIERMTSPEVRAGIEAGRTTAVVACGAVEQHGPHLPLFMDAEHGARLAEDVARRLGNALVAPPIRVGCSEHHMSFAGTMSLRVETFQAICADYCTSLARHGFRHVYFIPSHGGNYGPLDAVLESLNRAVGPATRVVAFTDLHAQIEIWRRVVEEEAGLGERVGGHADIAESSIMLALYPELVRAERAGAGHRGVLTPALLRRVFEEGIGAVAPNGILGDARGMSEAIGRRCIAETVDLLVSYFRERAAP